MGVEPIVGRSLMVGSSLGWWEPSKEHGIGQAFTGKEPVVVGSHPEA